MRPPINPLVVEELSLSEEQVENLLQLHDLLLKVPPPKFNMSHFVMTGTTSLGDPKAISARPQEWYLEACGTTCCALGLAAINGIGDMGHDTFLTYADENFGDDPDAWEWLFSSDWRASDNTPEGAAARIRWMLWHGVPRDYDSQQFGEVPLCYKEEERAWRS